MRLRLGTFNLFQFVEPPYSWYTKKEKFNARQWTEKITWVRQQILDMDCDIIGFQEVFSCKVLKKLVQELGFDYFKVVDTAKLSKNNRFKYITTTVAIASKHPIVNIQTIEAHPPSLKKHRFKEKFTFSRLPIKAIIKLPNRQNLLVYVCHLKSNRENAFEYAFHKEHTLSEKKEKIIKDLEHKASSSLQQRLCEASSLFYDIKSYKKIPKVLLCDLNDKEFSLTIDALTNGHYHDKNSDAFILYDASYEYQEKVYNPHPEAKKITRKPTSYFSGRGNVLDYIFISNDLKNKVTNYTILDAHLQENKDGSLLQSDHAQVICELTFSEEA